MTETDDQKEARRLAELFLVKAGGDFEEAALLMAKELKEDADALELVAGGYLNYLAKECSDLANDPEALVEEAIHRSRVHARGNGSSLPGLPGGKPLKQ